MKIFINPNDGNLLFKVKSSNSSFFEHETDFSLEELLL